MDEGGTYGEDFTPPTPVGPPGVPMPTPSRQRMRVPTAPERTVSARMGGQRRSYYIPTHEEQRTGALAEKVDELKKLGDVETLLAVGRAQGLLPVQQEAAQVEVPGVGKVNRAAIPAIVAQRNQEAAGARQTSQQTFAAGESAKLRKTQENVARIRTQARDVTTANQQRLAQKDRQNEFDELIASEVVQRAGTEADEKGIRATLDRMVDQDQTGTVKKRYLPILRKARGGAVKARSVGQMTPAELMAEIEKFSSGGAGEKTPTATPPKPKRTTAADLIADIEAKKRKAQGR